MAADSDEDVLDVAIVGAGVAGVYTGWRLLTDPPLGRPVPRVQVFEASHRIGGRLLSSRIAVGATADERAHAGRTGSGDPFDRRRAGGDVGRRLGLLDGDDEGEGALCPRA